MSKLPRHLAGIFSAPLAVALLAVPGLANATGVKVYSYAVKAVCEQDDDEELDTKINIHNPSLTGSAEYVLKIVWPGQGYTLLKRDSNAATSSRANLRVSSWCSRESCSTWSASMKSSTQATPNGLRTST
jgi:hypothetical protein